MSDAQTATSVPAKDGQSIAVVNLLMDSALRHHQVGHLNEAKDLYQKILAIDPSHVGSLHNLGLVAHAHGQYELAVTLIDRAIAVNDRIPAMSQQHWQ